MNVYTFRENIKHTHGNANQSQYKRVGQGEIVLLSATETKGPFPKSLTIKLFLYNSLPHGSSVVYEARFRQTSLKSRLFMREAVKVNWPTKPLCTKLIRENFLPELN